MICESNLEDSISNYFVDNLGYKKLTYTGFNQETLILESDLKSFLMDTQYEKCKKIINYEYNGDDILFFEDIYKEISDYVYSYNKDNSSGALNVAIQLGKADSFKFKGVVFTLYYSFNNKDNDKNIYTVVPQINFAIKGLKGSIRKKPDIGILVNGILFSFIQLKIQHRGQTAEKEGRDQIINDYTESIRFGVTDHILNNKIQFEKNEDRYSLIQKNIKCFHSPVHIVSMDMNDAYVIRGISKHYKELETFYLNDQFDDIFLKKEIKKSFFKDSIHIKEFDLNASYRTEKVLHELYSKDRIQNEILYFNFIGYDKKIEVIKNKKEVINKSNNTILNYPRPNQKYGVEKTIDEIVKKYKNENNKNYEIERLIKQLDKLGVSNNIKQNVINKRLAYKNNQNQFSILLQYAAGFGKTYIICWLSLIMKDLENINSSLKNDFLFDKIFIISDRVDLRDQIDRAMHNMNIDKTLFKEINTKEDLKKSLNETGPRIVIVNIQKFTYFKDILGEDHKDLLKNKRVAFLIDEIHRSNSGVQHQTMTSLFDEVVDSVSQDGDKKNLIIGLTATPTDENLARFGEYQGCTEDLKWMPFDSFTMEEAIKDGFVLDPTKNIIPFAVKLDFQVKDKKRLPTKKEIYEYRDRIKMNAKHMVHILFDTTFKKIKGNGKAMLCCYSIDAALAYYDALKKEMKNMLLDEKYSKYGNTGVYIVYSSTQDQIAAHHISGFANEKETINAFKNNRNGIIIVVDKLQTGFDEPRLHTLLLDKEITDINAVQTVCRVNRTMKGKEDCLVVDFSIDNINLSNIKNAFKKFSSVVASTFDSVEIKNIVEAMYKNIIKTEYYLNFFNIYKKDQENMEIAYQIQHFIDDKFKTANGSDEMINMGELFMNYLGKVGMIRNIIEINEKYTDYFFINYLREFLNIIRSKLNTSNSTFHEVVDFIVDSVGTIESSKIQIEDLKKKKIGNAKLKISNDDEYNIIAIIRELNKKEENKEILILEYEEKMNRFFGRLLEIHEKYNGLLLDDIDMYKKSSEFERFFNMTIRRMYDEHDMTLFIDDIKENILLMESDFFRYIRKNNLLP